MTDMTARVDALIHRMCKCSTIDDVDRQTVIDMRDALVMVCQREAAMIARCDAKLEAAEAERDAAMRVLQEAHDAMESCCDADAWAILRDAIAARQKGGE